MKLKKTLISLGATIAVTTVPIVTIISCGKETTKQATKKNNTTANPNKPSIKIIHTDNEDFPYDARQTSKWKTIPEGFDFSKIKKIPHQAFYHLKTLPDDVDFSNVTVVNDHAFMYLKKLPENIDFSKVRAIFEGAFSGLEELPENIDFSGVDKIGPFAFPDLKKFPKNIDFSNVRYIYGGAFPEIRELPEGFDLSNFSLLDKMYENLLVFPKVKELPKGFKINPEASFEEIWPLFRKELMEKIRPLIKK